MKNNQFNPATVALLGTNLIAASAGTGKTFNICEIYLRLLLEKDLNCENILVVTFTEAATAELKDRIRQRLRSALIFISILGEDSTPTEIEKDELILAQITNSSLTEVREKLLYHLRQFDRAAIFTIHGFCLRVLKENAFESQIVFNTDLTRDISSFLTETASDFWRQQMLDLPPLFTDYLLSNNWSPNQLVAWFQNPVTNPRIELRPSPVKIPSISKIEDEFTTILTELNNLYRTSLEELINLLEANEDLKKTPRGSLPSAIRQLITITENHFTWQPLPKDLIKFHPEEFSANFFKGKPAMVHPMIDEIAVLLDKHQQLEELYKQAEIELKRSFISFAREKLPLKKAQNNLMGFDDLLSLLHQALHGPSANQLKKILRKRYSAALIDEFQDTDSLQYEIFRILFHDKNFPLFLIGDPKQAIYGFRGADIHAYLDATREAHQHWTLPCNYRSEESLITAINDIFTQTSFPFIYDGIDFNLAEIPTTQSRKGLTLDGIPHSTCNFWYLPSETENKLISKDLASNFFFKLTAVEISKLLSFANQGRLRLNDKPVKAGDIAVLVKKNRQAFVMQNLLRKAGIASAVCSEGNVFETEEAKILLEVMETTLTPSNYAIIRRCLFSDLFSYTATQLQALDNQPQEMERWMLFFHQLLTCWNSRGFMAFFHQFFFCGPAEKIASFPDGERRITNFLHLAELLHEEFRQSNHTSKSLTHWFHSERSQSIGDQSKRLLRLESDDEVVQIVTVHKSKGLEYPIVFYPCSWDVKTRPPEHLDFHLSPPEKGVAIDLSPGKESEHLSTYNKEKLSEELRLLYVALTRAKNLIYTGIGQINSMHDSAFSSLLLKQENQIAPKLWKTAIQQNELFLQVEELANKNPHIILEEVTTLPPISPFLKPTDAVTNLSEKKSSTTIPMSQSISSFSSLSGHSHIPIEEPDYDLATMEVSEIEELLEEETFSLPGGTATGTMVHDFLEFLQFENTNPDYRKNSAARTLLKFGWSEEHLDTLCLVGKNTTSVEIQEGENRFTLEETQGTNRLTEMGFHFKISNFTTKFLKKLLNSFGGVTSKQEKIKMLKQVNFSELNGFMTGFVDLIFRHNNRYYIIDWKTNYLGQQLKDYQFPQLKKAILNSSYLLQYVIYCVALHQHLQTTLSNYQPNLHFGGVFYFFLRGINPTIPMSGIFHDKPEADFFSQVDEMFKGVDFL